MYGRAAHGDALHIEDVQSHQPWGSVEYTTARIWREYALALIVPQRWPDYVSDADIDATMRHVAATERLPWEIYADDGRYIWSE